MTQMRAEDGPDKTDSHGDGEKWSSSGRSMKAEPTGFADGLDVGSKNIEKSGVIARILA